MQVLGEDTESDEENDYTGNSEFVENALKSNSDIELKTLASGAMVVLQHIGKLPMIPQTVPTQDRTQRDFLDKRTESNCQKFVFSHMRNLTRQT